MGADNIRVLVLGYGEMGHAMEFLLGKMKGTRNNEEFFKTMNS